MKAAKLQADGSLKLPKEILRLFRSESELAVQPSQIAERQPEEEMPIEEIAAEVHKIRREKRSRRG